MSGPITKVALAGATGNLGPKILTHLLAANFSVTVLTRQGSTHNFPASVAAVKEVDYDSLDSLTDALRGQDAVVSAVAGLALSKQLLLVEAATAAGVKRFLPGEYGSDTTNPKLRSLPIFAPKISVQDALKKKAAEGKLSYTFVMTGAFLDWGLYANFLVDLQNRRATLVDGGERLFSVSTLDDVGKAVVGVLKHPEETENRAVYVQSAATSIKALVQKASKNVPIKTDVISTEDILAEAWTEFKKETPNPAVFFTKFLFAVIADEGYGSLFQKLDNELLDIQQLSEEGVDAIVAKYAV